MPILADLSSILLKAAIHFALGTSLQLCLLKEYLAIAIYPRIALSEALYVIKRFGEVFSYFVVVCRSSDLRYGSKIAIRNWTTSPNAFSSSTHTYWVFDKVLMGFFRIARSVWPKVDLSDLSPRR